MKDTNPNCTVCDGTGEDLVFGGKCSECWFDPRTDQVRRMGLGNPDTPQPMPTGGAARTTKAPPSNDDWKKQCRWTKHGNLWVIVVPKVVKATTGQIVQVHKKGGEVADVMLGNFLDKTNYGDSMFQPHQEMPNTTAVATATSKPLPVERITPDVPQGHYAIQSKGDNDLLFVRVDRPTSGKWAGYSFVKMVVGGRPDAPLKGAHGRAVLERILADGVEAAAQLYGQQLGRCSRCNRTLTDQDSRALGIGPECRTR